MPNPRADREAAIRAAQKQFIIQATQLSAWTTTQLARAAALAPSTVNRFLNSEVTHALTTKTLDKIMGATIARVQQRMREETDPAKKAILQRDLNDLTEKWSPVLRRGGSDGALQLDRVLVVGAVQGGLWAESDSWPEDEHYVIEVPPSRKYPGVRRRGLEVRGPSVNLLYPEGTVVIFASPEEIGHGAIPGKPVVVQRVDKFGRYETTIKIYQPDEDGRVWLWPKSDHPEFQRPIELKPSADIEEIKIIGLVIGKYAEED